MIYYVSAGNHAGREDAPIIYRSQTKGAAVITGAERITSWEKVPGEEGKWRLATNLYDYIPNYTYPVLGTEELGKAFEPEARFENPDGTPIRFDTDYHGVKAENRIPGPFII